MAECQEERAVNEEKWHRSLVEVSVEVLSLYIWLGIILCGLPYAQVKAKMRSKYDARLQKLQLRFAAEQERVLEMVSMICLVTCACRTTCFLMSMNIR